VKDGVSLDFSWLEKLHSEFGYPKCIV
jgi:hypothetical protein